MIALRSSGVIGPRRADGGRIMARSTIDGVPLPSRNETSASPLPSSVITCAVSSFGIGPEGLGRGLHRLLVARREGAQRVLHAVAELRQHLVRHVERVLRDEIDADALGADQPHHLLDLVQQRLGRVVEQQMRLVEEEHELRLVGIADFRQLLEQLRQQPQQERRVEPRVLHQLVGGEDVDDAAAVAVGAHEVLRASSAGSPKNLSPPWFSSTSSWRWMAPTVAVETLPYCVVQLGGVLGDDSRASRAGP